jgi:hypothetical protein
VPSHESTPDALAAFIGVARTSQDAADTRLLQARRISRAIDEADHAGDIELAARLRQQQAEEHAAADTVDAADLARVLDAQAELESQLRPPA